MYERPLNPETDTWVDERYRRLAAHDPTLVIIYDALEESRTCMHWRLADPDQRCRHMSKRKGCGRPAVVQLLRNTRWHGYCGLDGHLYAYHWDAEDHRLLSCRVTRPFDSSILALTGDRS